MQYRPEIDGLRAVAVIAVILFHAGFAPFAGGFVGVDVFFVISGYLIATIILSEISGGTFTITGFYERRARRILPALFLVILVSIPFGWFWMAPKELNEFAASIGAITIFSSNFLFWANSGYFDGAIELKPFIHTWSLAVEEQFYVVFPLLMLVLWRFGMRVMVAVFLVLLFLSLGLSEWTSRSGNEIVVSANFFLAHTRAWELLIGAVLACYLFRRAAPKGGFINDLGSLAGLAMVVFAVLRFDALTPFPGVAALLPTVGTALIILLANRETWTGRMLASRGFVAVGLISYSTYLWHQPLFAFARIRSMNEPGTIAYLALAALALVLGWLSWRFVERPFRDRSTTSRRQIFLSSAVVATMVFALSMTVLSYRGFPQRLGFSFAEARTSQHPRPKASGGCKNRIPKDGECIFGAQREPTVAFLGDSHAGALAALSIGILDEHAIGAVDLSQTSCIPIVNLLRVGKFGKCREFNDAVLEYVKTHDKIETLILSARWTTAIEQHTFDNHEGGVEPGPYTILYPVGREASDFNAVERKQMVAAYIRAGVSQYLELGKRVILIYPVPEVGWDPLRYAFRKVQFDGANFADLELTTSYPVFQARNRRANAALDAIPDHDRLFRVRPGEMLCDTLIKGRCVVASDGIQYYRDDDHLGMAGTRLVMAEVMQILDDPAETDAEIPEN